METTSFIPLLSAPFTIPQSYISHQPESARLVGFYDASTKAYAAVVYLRLEHDTTVYVRFAAAKTRVALQKGITIPRLELLSALLLAKLIVSVQAALQAELTLHSEPVCYTDSNISFYWIQGTNREWRQFIENYVIIICTLLVLAILQTHPLGEYPLQNYQRSNSG